MALEIGGRRLCKVSILDNGRMMHRRVQLMIVQSLDGKLKYLRDAQLPNEIYLFQEMPKRGGSVAEVLVGEEPAITPQMAVVELRPRWPKPRDILHMACGLVALGLLKLVAIAAATIPQ